MTFARHITVFGRVQGVGYRAWLQGEAVRRGLKGWVRNRRDGSVEALLAGEEAAVNAMIQACGQGPTHAAVSYIELAQPWENDIPDRDGFRIDPTA